jgi:hypothetical protein
MKQDEPCTVCDGKCSGLHDSDDGGAQALCHCAGCDAERVRQGVPLDSLYSYALWKRDTEQR